MPGTEFKNQVDNLMNILFGAGVASHATIIEQINYLVFLRSLSKKDDNAMILDSSAEKIFSGELAKYHWDNLLVLNAEVLFTTLEDIFRKLPELATDQTIRLLFRDAHVKIFDKPTLRRLVHEIEKMMSGLEKEAISGHTDIFGDMYEYLLSKLSQSGTMGSFRTPRHIIKFIVDVIDPNKGETILDPACGTAGFLVSALEHLKNKYTSDELKKEGRLVMDKLNTGERDFVYQHTFTGFDSDFDMFKFGLMNLYLHKLEHPNIKRQNTLVDTAGDRTKWDIILANPPFAGALDQDSVSEDLRMNTRATEVLFLKYIIDHLSQNGRAGVIVPEGVVFSTDNAHKKIRQILVEDAGLWCVVSLPSGVFNPYAGVKTSILFFDKSKKDKKKEILFIKVEHDGFELGAQRKPIDKNDLPDKQEIINAFASGTINFDDNSLVVFKEDIARSGDYSLSGDKYRQKSIHVDSKWPIAKIGDIATLMTGGTPLTSKKEYYGGNIKWLVSGDINKGEIFDCDGRITDLALKESNAKLLPVSSVLIALNGQGKTRGMVAMLRVEATCNQSLVSINPDRSKLIPEFLFYVLKGKYQEIRDINGDNQRGGLNMPLIRSIEIPLPPLEIQNEIVEELGGYQKIIDGAKQVIESWKPKIDINPEWKMVKLGEACDVRDGTHDSPKQVQEGYPLVTSKNIKNGEIDFSGVSYISEEDFIKVSHRSQVDVGDIIMPMIGTIGGACLIKTKEKEFAIKNVALFKKSEIVIPGYLLIILDSDLVSAMFDQQSAGSTQKFVSLGVLRGLVIPLPPLGIQKQIVEKIEEERKLVEGNKKLIEIYQSKIKDTISKVWKS